MQIRFHCPNETCVAIIEYEPLESCGDSMRCPRCKVEHKMVVTDSVRDQAMIERCAVCGGRELFIRKDFPQGFGMAVVIVFGLAALYYFNESILISWSILGTALLLDLVIYFLVGKVTTCYACRAEYRKGVLNPNHEQFDLATSEKY
ncbi:MAG: hypothetical protein ACE5E5_12355 [Phycisphaerae bacterium]